MESNLKQDLVEDNVTGSDEEEKNENEEDLDEDGIANIQINDEWFISEELLKTNNLDLSDEELELRKAAAENLKNDGNKQFAEGNYKEAASTYTLALNTCPLTFNKDRAVLFANRAACFLYIEKTKLGIEDCTKSLELNPTYLKALLRRAVLYEKDEKLDEALEDYKKILEMDPRNPKALDGCMRLPSVINERNEKLKTEMLSKLKDLGNLVLRPFGLSTNNFQLQQDPNTGSYSVNFQQNK